MTLGIQDESQTWVAYTHFQHGGEMGWVSSNPNYTGTGILFGYGEGPADAWIVDVVNKRVVWYGHCSIVGPIAPPVSAPDPESTTIDIADWGTWTRPKCCGEVTNYGESVK